MSLSHITPGDKVSSISKTNIMFLLFLAFFCLAFPVSSQETDSLQQGHFLNSSSQLVSANKLYVLGFYSPDPKNFSNIYLAIWCKSYDYSFDVDEKKYDFTYYSSQNFPVWIGNRNSAIRNNSAFLSLDSYGNLFIKSNTSSDSFILYSSGRQFSINTTATLLDSGNFVVREINSNGSEGWLLWQSFDYPTDTLLTGMKLGVNHRTGLNWTLTSWFSDIKPKSGAFSLEWDYTNLQLVIRRHEIIVWTSGGLKDMELNGIMGKGFEFLRPDKEYKNYQFFTEKNADEEYFYYKVMNTSTLEPRNIISKWLLNPEGRLEDPNSGHAVADLNLCYYGIRNKADGRDIVKGCKTWEQPKCRNMYLIFEMRSGWLVDSNQNEPSPVHYSNFSTSDCREKCWKDCHCVGYNYSDYGEPDCQIWSGRNLSFQVDYLGVEKARYVIISYYSKKKWKIGVIIAAVVVSLVTFMFGLFCYLKKRKHKQDG